MTRLAFGLVVMTSSPMEQLENWLNERSQGEWQVSLLDLDDETRRKKVHIHFERESDRDNFKALFVRKPH